MGSASRVFFLSVFALWAAPIACSSSQDSCPISPSAIVDDACVSYADLDNLNNKIKLAIDDLVQSTDFFSHYRLNLFNKECPFWDDQNGICGNIGCSVETLDNEEDVPEIWRASELSKLEGPRASHPGKDAQKEYPERPLRGELGEKVGESCVVEYDDEGDDRDYCVLEDEETSSKGDYVSLLRNPERFTGYGGQGAKQVWDSVYLENCFQKSSFPKSADLGISNWPQDPAVLNFKQVLDTAGRHAQLEQQRLGDPDAPFASNSGFEVDDQCLEKRVFYRVISGMHASISVHLCWDFLNQTTGEWQPNLSCYESRLHRHPDHVSNLYFNYALVTRAIAKLGPYINGPQYTFCTGDPWEDNATRSKVRRVTQHAVSVPKIFDESLMFVNGEGPSLKEDFRSRFRNISRLMDCVGCDKCRLWGKVQTNGYGTALKVLFEFGNDNVPVPHLKRTEVVALFNTYARLSESLRSIAKFRAMLDMRKAAEAGKAFTPEDFYELVEEDDEDMREFIRMRNSGPEGDGVGDVVEHELARFKTALKIVIKSWLRTPRMIWEILSDETIRIYRMWIGLPPLPRRYAFRLPNLDRDEL